MFNWLKKLFGSTEPVEVEAVEAVETYEVQEEIVEVKTKINFNKMKKTELVQYIKDNNLDINPKLKKAEIVALLTEGEA